jgi:ferredoxin
MSGSRVAKYANFVGILTIGDLVREIHISASGGCQSWDDIVEYIMYGASSVQLQSIFIQKGFSVIKELKERILKYMEQKNFNTLDEMKGIIFPKLLTYDESIAAYGQTKGKVIASVDMEECNLCGLCEDTCIYDAIRISDERLTIIEDNCEGCRACVISCPQNALTLQNVDQIMKVARG